MMNALPAKVAGVGELIMWLFPRHAGEPQRTVLAAARVRYGSGIRAVGGPRVAGLAYGTDQYHQSTRSSARATSTDAATVFGGVGRSA